MASSDASETAMTAPTGRVRAHKAKSPAGPDGAASRRRSPTTAAGVAKAAVPLKGSHRRVLDKRSNDGRVIAYSHSRGVDAFVQRIADATPMELIETERSGVEGRFIRDLALRIDVPAVRLYAILGIPRATVEKRVAEGKEVSGAAGLAALGMARLLAKTQAIVNNSTSAAAGDFDAGKWLGRWIEISQPSLAGRKPAELIATPTGLEVVYGLLGAIESGAYQ